LALHTGLLLCIFLYKWPFQDNDCNTPSTHNIFDDQTPVSGPTEWLHTDRPFDRVHIQYNAFHQPSAPGCGICRECKNGHPDHCIPLIRASGEPGHPATIGIFSDGAMTSYAIVPRQSLYKISKDIGFSSRKPATVVEADNLFIQSDIL